MDSLHFPLIYFLFHARHFSPSVIENNSSSPSLLFCQRDLKGFKSMPFREVLEGGRKQGWESKNWPKIYFEKTNLIHAYVHIHTHTREGEREGERECVTFTKDGKYRCNSRTVFTS